MKYVFDRAQPAIADDMPPHMRAIAMLLEHANARVDAGQSVPCPCAECQQHRASLVGVHISAFKGCRWKAVNPVRCACCGDPLTTKLETSPAAFRPTDPSGTDTSIGD